MKPGVVWVGERGTPRRHQVLEWMAANGLDPMWIPEESRIIIRGRHITYQEIVTKYQRQGARVPVVRYKADGTGWLPIRRRTTRLRVPLEAPHG